MYDKHLLILFSDYNHFSESLLKSNYKRLSGFSIITSHFDMQASKLRILFSPPDFSQHSQTLKVI